MQEKIEKVRSLILELRTYYEAHRTSDNESLVYIANGLDAYSKALALLLTFDELGDMEIQVLDHILRPVNPKVSMMWEQLKRNSEHIIGGRRTLKTETAKSIMNAINGIVDVGRQLLVARKMEAEGKSEQEIKYHLDNDWKIENVF
jgi:hypothetical protein